jgi:hypothetical protein
MSSLIIEERNNKMAPQLDPKEIVDFRELLLSEVILSDALLNLLDRKGIINE